VSRAGTDSKNKKIVAYNIDTSKKNTHTELATAQKEERNKREEGMWMGKEIERARL